MEDPTLFPTDSPPQELQPAGPFAAVAIERSLDRVLDYCIPPSMVASLRVGQRVRVPLGRGNKPTSGYVTEIRPTTDASAKIKSILGIEDDRVLLSPALMELAQWVGRYYCCALGTVLESVIPSAVKKKVGLEYTRMVRLVRGRDEIQQILEKTRAPKRRAILARLLQLPADGSIDVAKLASESGATLPTVRKLVKLGVASITPEPQYTSLIGANESRHPALNAGYSLNDDQQRAFDDIRPRLASGFSVNLLYGVTGSGKTELYLRCIEDAVARGRRAIVLVPEIALTPQTVQRFTARFSRVAVLHSGLAATNRHQYWQQIAEGRADVVVGARSAIFAPVPDLGIIVVDEEHESSYKQDTAPRYHARDLAIKRGQLENVPVLLGSATPSLEMWHRAGGGDEATKRRSDEGEGSKTGDPGRAEPGSRYHLLTLAHRVRGLALPKVELIDMRREAIMRRPGIHVISKRLESLLGSAIREGHQAILLLNRRGYANYIFCSSCQHVMQCKYCDVTLTYHRSAGAEATSAKVEQSVHTGQLHCHYCLAVNPLPQTCPECGKKLILFGLGTQRVEEELRRKFPELKYARVDSDSMRGTRDYESVLGRFGRGELQVLLGTQMIAKGLDYPNVTLVGVINGDTALSLPDFRAAERTFQLITQVAGRAGRGDVPGQVVVQTFRPDESAIQLAIQQNYIAFGATELARRREMGLPPMRHMVRVVLRDQELPELHKRGNKMAEAINSALTTLTAASVSSAPSSLSVRGLPVEAKGPMPCAIDRIAGYHRQQILLFSASRASLQRLLAIARKSGAFSITDRIAVDVDPVSLL